MVVNFRGDQIYVDFVRFLIHEDLYAWCLKHNICSAWFLDIRISTCSNLRIGNLACGQPTASKFGSKISYHCTNTCTVCESFSLKGQCVGIEAMQLCIISQPVKS